MSFVRFSAIPHCKDLPAVVGEFWSLADWLPYLPDLNLLDYSIWFVLQLKAR
jgi:hypothetical protein